MNESKDFKKWIGNIDKWLSEAKYKDVIALQVEPMHTPRAMFSPCRKYVLFPMQDHAIDLTTVSKKEVQIFLESARERVAELRRARRQEIEACGHESLAAKMHFARRLSDAIIEECFLEQILCDVTDKEMPF